MRWSVRSNHDNPRRRGLFEKFGILAATGVGALGTRSLQPLGGKQDPSGFVPGFTPLLAGNRICDNPGPHMEVQLIPFLNDGSDRDVEAAFAAFPEPADCAGVQTSGKGFDFADDFPRPFLRCAGD